MKEVNVQFAMDKEYRDVHQKDLLPEQREEYNEDFARKILKDRYEEFVKFYEVSVLFLHFLTFNRVFLEMQVLIEL